MDSENICAEREFGNGWWEKMDRKCQKTVDYRDRDYGIIIMLIWIFLIIFGMLIIMVIVVLSLKSFQENHYDGKKNDNEAKHLEGWEHFKNC